MNFIFIVIFVFAFSIIVFAFIDLKLSIALYISYMILVPYLQFDVAGLSLSYNLVNTVLLIAFLYQWKKIKKKKRYKYDFRTISPFFFLYSALLLLTLFAWFTPWSIQFNSWRISFMQTCIVAFIIWNLSRFDSKVIVYIKWSLIISIVIASIYGIFLMDLNGLNPYTSFLALHFNGMDGADMYLNTESRLDFSTAGKIQSTMIHPMRWSMNLCFLIIIFLSFIQKNKSKWYWIIIILIGFNILISGVRTGIAALVIGFVYYFLRNRNLKTISYGLLIITVSYVAINYNKNISNLFTSFTDISGNKSKVQGSSISMRLNQLQGATNEIRGKELVGKGYGWNNYYQSKHGVHPVLFAFESLIFVVLCNNGILGIFIWIIFIGMMFRLQRKILKSKEDVIWMDTFILTYIAYAIGTGEYGYIELFSIYYVFLLSYFKISMHQNSMIILRKPDISLK